MNDIAAPTTAAVPAAKTSPAQVIQQLQPSISPSSDPSGYRAIARPNLASKSSLEIELAKGAKAWRKYRSINDRDAVYIYLASVFDIVMRWQRLDCALKKSRAALRLRPTGRR